MSKLRTRHIVSGHLATFRNYESGRTVPKDFATFLGLPALIAAGLTAAGARIPETAIGALIAGLAIFTGLLFNLLLLVADVATRTDNPDPAVGTRRLRLRVQVSVLQELHANVSFAVLCALFALIVLIGLSLEGDLPGRRAGEALAFFLGALFLLTLLMILKRAYALLSSQVEEVKRKAS